MEVQALSITCEHLHEYTNTELLQLRREICKLQQQILDLQMEVCIYKALHKVWKTYALIHT